MSLSRDGSENNTEAFLSTEDEKRKREMEEETEYESAEHDAESAELYDLADWPTAQDVWRLGFETVVQAMSQGGRRAMAQKTGEFRAPKKDEWFLSGSGEIPMAYRASKDLIGKYDIVRLVTARQEMRWIVETD